MIFTNLKINMIRAANYIRLVSAHILKRNALAFWGLLLLSCIKLLLPIDNSILALGVNLAFWVGLGLLLFIGWRGHSWPKLAQTDRLLEDSNELYDRPLLLLNDQLANSSFKQELIWNKFKAQLVNRFSDLKLPPVFYLSGETDPHALRVIPILLFTILFFSLGPNASYNKLQMMVVPQIAGGVSIGGTPVPAVSIQISPPEHTSNLPQIVKGSGHVKQTLNIAENSNLRITIRQKWFRPQLKINGSEHTLEPSVEKNNNEYIYEYNVGAYRAEQPTHNISVKVAFLPLFSLNFNLINDLPPKLEISKDFKISRNGTLKLSANIEDDYGTENLKIFMDLPVDFKGEVPLGQAYHEKRSFLYSEGSHQDVSISLNLTRHTYAGLKTNLHFNVVDGAGQISETVTIPITLPEREFTEDIAKRIIALRKFIISDKLSYPNYIFDSLSEFTSKPSVINHDEVAQLTLSVARERILHAPNIDTLYDLIDILWRTALRLDKGEFLQSQQELQDAINALNDVLNDPNASQDEKLKAMRDLQNALALYFQQAQKEALRQMQDEDVTILPKAGIPSPNSNALKDFLSQLEDMALNDPSKAKDLLNELEKALNSLNDNMQAELPADIKQMMKFMEDMDKILEAQRDLLDKSRMHSDYLEYLARSLNRRFTEDSENSDHGQKQKITDMDSFMKSLNLPSPDIHDNKGLTNTPSNEGGENYKKPAPTMDVIMEAGTQRHIQDQLHDMIEEMPIVPDELQDADKHMGNSATFLEYERLEKSIPEQEKILEALSQKREDMQQAFEERLKQFAKDNNIRFSFDPLGRASGDNGLTRSLHAQEYDLPEKGKKNYIDEILRQLRENAGDMDKPKIEREYYKRLLHQW